MKRSLLVVFLWMLLSEINAQSVQNLYTEMALYGKRQRMAKDIRENVIAKTFLQNINEDNEHRFESACNAISQFLIKNDTVKLGFRKLFTAFDQLQYDTRKALLEAVYAVYPTEFTEQIQQIFRKQTDAKLFSMAAAYWIRANPSIDVSNQISIRTVEQFSEPDSFPILESLTHYVQDKIKPKKTSAPSVKDLIQFHKEKGNKVIYSFQRENRDYPGMAIVQNADGSFVRRADGAIMMFEQLARSGSSLPYFISNGNTPQGMYSIQGTAVSRLGFIGPTPNIQLVMPLEDSSKNFFHGLKLSNEELISHYQNYWPASWLKFKPRLEALEAGKIGRSEIIAHGTTIDPEFFKDYPFYPLTPTMGCLCAKELWNVTTGKPLVSEQFNMYSAFMSTPGAKGYLIVINLNDKNGSVTRAELEALLK